MSSVDIRVVPRSGNNSETRVQSTDITDKKTRRASDIGSAGRMGDSAAGECGRSTTHVHGINRRISPPGIESVPWL